MKPPRAAAPGFNSEIVRTYSTEATAAQNTTDHRNRRLRKSLPTVGAGWRRNSL